MSPARRSLLTLSILASLAGLGCESPSPAPTDAAASDAGPAGDAFMSADAASADTSSATDTAVPTDAPVLPDAFAPACMPLATDYPGSADYVCPAVSGSATYPRIGASISSVARVEQYHAIAALLFDPTTDPSATAFTDARTQYATAEGIGSRVGRRFDYHLPPAAPSGSGRLCQTEASWQADPLFCVGPASLSPIILDALQRGATSDPSEPSRVHAARIHAALTWFIHTSVYKETASCALLFPGNDGKREDCDSAWAYYTAGRERSAPLADEIGLAAQIRTLDEDAHTRILDGLFAIRCWRDMDTSGAPPDPLPAYDMPDLLSDRALYERAHQQLDVALDRGLSRILVDHLESLRATTGDEQRYHLAFLRTLLAPIAARTITDGTGASISYPAREPLFDRTLRGVSAADADFVRGEIQREVAVMDVDGIIRRLDAAFPCP